MMTEGPPPFVAAPQGVPILSRDQGKRCFRVFRNLLEVVIKVPLRSNEFANFHYVRGQAFRRQLKVITGAAP